MNYQGFLMPCSQSGLARPRLLTLVQFCYRWQDYRLFNDLTYNMLDTRTANRKNL